MIISFSFQIPHNERYIIAIPCNTAGARGRPDKDGSKGCSKIELQAFVVGAEDRGTRADAAQHRRRATDMSEGQGKVQSIGERDCVEDQAYGRHEGDSIVRRDRSIGDGYEKEVDETADIDELRGAVCAIWL